MVLVKSKLHSLWLLLLYFLYIFNISFAPFPYYVRTRIIFGVLGLLLGLLLLRQRVSKSVIYFMVAVLLLLVPCGLTFLVNGVFDAWFIQYAAQQVLHLSGAYLLVLLSLQFVKPFDLNRLFLFIIYAVALNNLLAAVMFIAPPLQDFMLAIQNHDELARTKLEEYLDMDFRLYGLGIHTFFMGGLLSGYSLLLAAYLLRKERRGKQTLWLTLLFLFIAITGLFIARTTLVGAAIGTVYILWPSRWSATFSRGAIKRNFLFIAVLLASMIFGVIALNYFFPEAWDSDIIGYALEFYIRMDQGDALATESTDHLKTMYIWPDSWRTWLIGDGRFNVPGGFYMDTDVGYLRMIYYFGVTGMLLFFVIQFVLVERIHRFYRDRHVSFFLFASAVFVLLLNLKALADVNAFFYLILWLAIIKRDESLENAKKGENL